MRTCNVTPQIMEASVVHPLPENLESMTVAQLKDLCEDRGYEYTHTILKKADYIARIRA